MRLSTQFDIQNEFGDRVCTLSDGRPGIRGGIRVTAKETGADVIDFTASDETLDRYDEVLTAKGWELENYQKNPVFQNAHQYGDVMFTLGRALITQVRGSRLYQRIQFATAVNPIAKITHGLYRGGFLNAVSVGFIPLEWEPGEPGSGVNRRYTRQELLECSAVAVPANPNALVMGVKSGAIDLSDMREAQGMIEMWLGRQAIWFGRASGKPENAEFGQLLQLARDFKRVVRGSRL